MRCKFFVLTLKKRVVTYRSKSHFTVSYFQREFLGEFEVTLYWYLEKTFVSPKLCIEAAALSHIHI